MRNDRKVIALRRKFPCCLGYAVWNMLLETMCDFPDRCIKWDTMQQEILASDFDIEKELLVEIVDYCATVGLLQIHDDYICCERFQENFAALDKKREAGRRGASVRWGETPQQMAPDGTSIAENAMPQSATEMPDGNKNKNKNKNKISSSLVSSSFEAKTADEEEKEKIIYKFFFSNWAKPNVEYRKFLSWNNSDGRVFDSYTPKQKQKAIDSWEQTPAQRDRFGYDFISCWKDIVDFMIRSNTEHRLIIDALSDKIRWQEDGDCSTLTCSRALAKFIDDNMAHFRPILLEHFPDLTISKRLKYSTYG